MAKITILGSGGFGISLAVMAAKYDHNVTLWSAFKEEIDLLSTTRENKKLLPGIILPENVNLTTDISVINNCDLIIIAVPSFAVRDISKLIAKNLTTKVIIASVAKGLEASTHLRLSQVIEQELPDNEIVIISGPSHAEEIARGVPTTVVAASKSIKAATFIQDILMNDTLRIYTNDDIIGVELGGALKNIIALAAGICDGLGLGDNTKAALMTRGLSEIARLGVAVGARNTTFAGLAGVGDLIVTCTSTHSRNWQAGNLIGKGLTPTEALEQVGKTVEGYHATKSAFELAKIENVDLPITTQLYLVLYEGKGHKQAISDLMTRPKKHETEHVWF